MRPTKAELAAARGAVVPDVLPASGDEELTALFVGINPSLYSAAVGAHFARPGNRFWRVLHLAGLTDRQLEPSETASLRAAGIGVTNLVARATARADQLTSDELRAGARRLARLVARCSPRHVAVLGLDAFRAAFDRPRARAGRQPEALGRAALWALPNPSGLNASYSMPALVAAYAELAAAVREAVSDRPRTR